MKVWRYLRLRKDLMRAVSFVLDEARNPHGDSFGYAVVEVNRGAWNRLDQIHGWIVGRGTFTDPGANARRSPESGDSGESS